MAGIATLSFASEKATGNRGQEARCPGQIGGVVWIYKATLSTTTPKVAEGLRKSRTVFITKGDSASGSITKVIICAKTCRPGRSLLLGM